MKLWSKNIFLILECVFGVVVIAAGVLCKRFSASERNNVKAVQKAEIMPEEALEYLQKAVRLNPDNPVIHLNLGLLYSYGHNEYSIDNFIKQQRSSVSDLTVAEFEKAVYYSENEPIPVLNLAIANAIQGKETEAIQLLKPLVKQNFCWLPVRVLYGLLQERQECMDMARDALTEAVLQTPIVMESQFFYDLRERNECLAKAIIEGAKQSAQCEYQTTENPLATAILGEIEFIEGNVEIAEKYLKEAVSALPSMNRPWLFLGRIEDTRGNKKLALDYYNKAAQLDKYDALPVYFKAKIEGKAAVVAEQMQPLLSLEPRRDMRGRYGTSTMMEPLIMPDFERYCTYDYAEEIEQTRYSSNIDILNNVLEVLDLEADSTKGKLAASIAEKMIGTPYEAGLLDAYPERLRVYLDKTDNLHFIESCVAITLLVNEKRAEIIDVPTREAYEVLCRIIESLRYRVGVISSFTDRIFYFSEWVEQARDMGLIEEYSSLFGHEYNLVFSYLSDHLAYLPQAGREPNAREKVKEIEKKMSENYHLYAISPNEMTSEFYKYLQDGDIVALVSDRKGEDVDRIGIVKKTETSLMIISASYKEKKVIAEDFKASAENCKAIRMCRLL